jgi:hypothetical protein
MHKGSLAAPYDGATIESNNTSEAIDKAKQWASAQDDKDGAWPQITLDGKSVASFKPGEY